MVGELIQVNMVYLQPTNLKLSSHGYRPIGSPETGVPSIVKRRWIIGTYAGPALFSQMLARH